MYYELIDHFIVSSSIERTWEFFGSAENLSKITPSWLAFTVRGAPGAIGPDAVLDYSLKWLGVPVRWRTRIIDWSPPRQFIDLQTRGPYALWHHQHTFEPTDAGVVCRDRVIYKLPVAPVAPLVHRLVVRRQLLDIFRHRRKVIAENLGWVAAGQDDVTIGRLV